MNIGILLRLLFAHIFADFFLQTTKMCEEKSLMENRNMDIYFCIA